MIKRFLKNRHENPEDNYGARNFVEGDRVITLDEFFGELRDKHYILIGESPHNDPLMIDTQLSMLKAAFLHNPNIVLGVEVLASHNQQELVDSYMGHQISLEQLAQSSYCKDASLYKDMLDFARENRIRVVPLSATSEEAFGMSDEEVRKLTVLNDASAMLRGYRAHDDVMARVLKEIPEQVLACLGVWHTCKTESGNITKKLPNGSFVTGHIDDTTFKVPGLDNQVLVYSSANPNHHSWDYKIIRTKK